MMRVSREVLASMLRKHGEGDLAERARSVSDDELARIGMLGDYYAFSADAMALGGSMGGARALSLASVDVLDGTGRDLRLSRTEWERQGSSFDRFAEDDAIRDPQLRRHAAEKQIPADESKITLDSVDPPAWEPAPPDATPLIIRCHDSTLRVDTAFWDQSPDSDVELNKRAGDARGRFKLAPELRELIGAFNREHSARRTALRARLASS